MHYPSRLPLPTRPCSTLLLPPSPKRNTPEHAPLTQSLQLRAYAPSSCGARLPDAAGSSANAQKPLTTFEGRVTILLPGCRLRRRDWRETLRERLAGILLTALLLVVDAMLRCGVRAKKKLAPNTGKRETRSPQLMLPHGIPWSSCAMRQNPSLTPLPTRAVASHSRRRGSRNRQCVHSPFFYDFGAFCPSGCAGTPV